MVVPVRLGRKASLVAGIAAGMALALMAMLRRDRWLRDGLRSWVVQRITRALSLGGLMPDEQITLQAIDALEARGLWRPSLSIVTVDGTVYLRGRSDNSDHAEAVVRVVRTIPGVIAVADELKR